MVCGKPESSCTETKQLADIWYDLPCRIYGAGTQDNMHSILFSVYVHFDLRTKKTVLFYLFYMHRLGSEHTSPAELSSRAVKGRVTSAIQHTLRSPIHTIALQSSPFAVQLPTVTCSVIFWTETLHKERMSMWSTEDEAKRSLASVDTGFLHNVARYVHSYKANIEILQRTVHFIRSEHERFAQILGPQNGYTVTSSSFQTIDDSLAAQCFQMKTILTWTEEVVKRTQILIDLVGLARKQSDRPQANATLVFQSHVRARQQSHMEHRRRNA